VRKEAQKGCLTGTVEAKNYNSRAAINRKVHPHEYLQRAIGLGKVFATQWYFAAGSGFREP
ncbi:hypothetical protein QP168_10640, partial [Aerococcus urinae]